MDARRRGGRVALALAAWALAGCVLGGAERVAEGERLLAQGDAAGAARAFDAALQDPKLSPLDRTRAQVGEARAFLARGDLVGAKARFRRVADAVSDKWYGLGEVALREGDRAEAARSYELALERGHGGDAPGKFVLAAAGDAVTPDELRDVAGRVRTRSAPLADALLAAADAWRDLGAGGDAAALLARLDAGAGPVLGLPSVLVLRARLLDATGRAEEAAAAWQAFAGLAPAPAAALRSYADEARARAALERGGASLEAALAGADPAVARALRRAVAEGRAARGDWSGALEVWRGAAEAEGAASPAWAEVAWLAERLELPEADAAWAKAEVAAALAWRRPGAGAPARRPPLRPSSPAAGQPTGGQPAAGPTPPAPAADDAQEGWLEALVAAVPPADRERLLAEAERLGPSPALRARVALRRWAAGDPLGARALLFVGEEDAPELPPDVAAACARLLAAAGTLAGALDELARGAPAPARLEAAARALAWLDAGGAIAAALDEAARALAQGDGPTAARALAVGRGATRRALALARVELLLARRDLAGAREALAAPEVANAGGRLAGPVLAAVERAAQAGGDPGPLARFLGAVLPGLDAAGAARLRASASLAGLPPEALPDPRGPQVLPPGAWPGLLVGGARDLPDAVLRVDARGGVTVETTGVGARPPAAGLAEALGAPAAAWLPALDDDDPDARARAVHAGRWPATPTLRVD